MHPTSNQASSNPSHRAEAVEVPGVLLYTRHLLVVKPARHVLMLEALGFAVGGRLEAALLA